MRRARAESAGEELRLTYVALTRAQSQVVTWWGPSQNAAHSGLSRLLFGRTAGESTVPDRVPVPTDFEATAALAAWQEVGALAHELSAREPRTGAAGRPQRDRVAVRQFTRTIDTDWRRTSYSGLIRAEEQAATTAVDVEPEVAGHGGRGGGQWFEPSRRSGLETVADAPPQPPGADARSSSTEGNDVPSPMADLPAGATFGSLVHGVLEHADPKAPDLAAELRRHVAEQRRWWSVDDRHRRARRGAAAHAAHVAGTAGRRSPAGRHRVALTGCVSWTSSSRSSEATVPTGRSLRCAWV